MKTNNHTAAQEEETLTTSRHDSDQQAVAPRMKADPQAEKGGKKRLWLLYSVGIALFDLLAVFLVVHFFGVYPGAEETAREHVEAWVNRDVKQLIEYSAYDVLQYHFNVPSKDGFRAEIQSQMELDGNQSAKDDVKTFDQACQALLEQRQKALEARKYSLDLAVRDTRTLSKEEIDDLFRSQGADGSYFGVSRKSVSEVRVCRMDATVRLDGETRRCELSVRLAKIGRKWKVLDPDAAAALLP